MSDPISSTSNVSSEDFIKLFLQELNYQDPLKPMDNKEFMTQMAQFSNLKETSEINKNLGILNSVNLVGLGTNMLGKRVYSDEYSQGIIVETVRIIKGNGVVVSGMDMSQKSNKKVDINIKDVITVDRIDRK